MQSSDTVLSYAAAFATNATKHGPETATGEFLWYGYNYGVDVSFDADADAAGPEHVAGPAVTRCNKTDDGKVSWEPVVFTLVSSWMEQFELKNSTSDILGLSHEEFDSLTKAAFREYASIIGTADPDLSEFKQRGGKLLTFHGLVSFFRHLFLL